MTAVPRTAVVHLVWQPAGTPALEAFLRSYAQHDAGAEHDLVLLYNGFDREPPPREFAAGTAPAAREIVLDERCLDLRAYREAASRLPHERLCLLNSYSAVLAAGWLAKLEAPLADRAVGASGATGSYASHLEYGLYQLGLRSPYGRALASRRAAREAMHALSGTPVPGPVGHWAYSLAQVVRQRRGAARFPSPHLRTNAFVIERTLFEQVCSGPMATKWDTHLLESGPGSITARLRALSRPPVVVDRHGVAREVADWHRGDVFMQADQADLLVADNQTASYANASREQRAVLSALAWGPWSRPA